MCTVSANTVALYISYAIIIASRSSHDCSPTPIPYVYFPTDFFPHLLVVTFHFIFLAETGRLFFFFFFLGAEMLHGADGVRPIWIELRSRHISRALDLWIEGALKDREQQWQQELSGEYSTIHQQLSMTVQKPSLEPQAWHFYTCMFTQHVV